MRYLDLQSEDDLFENVTNARQLSELGKKVDEYRAYENLVIEATTRHNTVMEEGAKANIEQKELLLQQLEAIQVQNKLLENKESEEEENNGTVD